MRSTSTSGGCCINVLFVEKKSAVACRRRNTVVPLDCFEFVASAAVLFDCCCSENAARLWIRAGVSNTYVML